MFRKWLHRRFQQYSLLPHPKKNDRHIFERRLTLQDPKSGRDQEFIFIPHRLADRLKEYVRQKGVKSHERIFPICYESAREMVAKAGGVVGIHLRPHDLSNVVRDIHRHNFHVVSFTIISDL